MLLYIPVLGILRIVFSYTEALEAWAFLLSAKPEKKVGVVFGKIVKRVIGKE